MVQVVFRTAGGGFSQQIRRMEKSSQSDWKDGGEATEFQVIRRRRSKTKTESFNAIKGVEGEDKLLYATLRNGTSAMFEAVGASSNEPEHISLEYLLLVELNYDHLSEFIK